jgi:hypothetical protein
MILDHAGFETTNALRPLVHAQGIQQQQPCASMNAASKVLCQRSMVPSNWKRFSKYIVIVPKSEVQLSASAIHGLLSSDVAHSGPD